MNLELKKFDMKNISFKPNENQGPVIVLIGIMFGFYYLYIRLPIINGYAAKNMCSCVFVAGREQKDIEANDLNFSLVKYASNTIDFENKTVTSSFWGMRSQMAFYNEKTGCSLVNTRKPFNTKELNITPPKSLAISFLFLTNLSIFFN